MVETLIPTQADRPRSRSGRLLPIPLEQRFWAKVDKRGPDECWPWIGGSAGNGYGCIGYGTGNRKAHQVSVILSGRDIPRGMHVDHICRNRGCVNPAHLRVVTPRQNALENSESIVAINARKTHCPQGHPLEAGRLTNGDRCCRICRRAQDAAYRQKKRLRALGGPRV